MFKFYDSCNRTINEYLAFTLAEVLITLGIIGVIAAITLPALIQKNNNLVVETRLKKFYSSINQAVLMAENDYGDKNIWFEEVPGAEFDKNGNVIENSSKAEKWFNKYIGAYMKTSGTKILEDGTFIVYFPDGSALKQYQQQYSRGYIYFTGNPERCIKRYGFDLNKGGGICMFAFIFYPNATHGDWIYHKNKGFEPWKWQWDGNRDFLITRCRRNSSNAFTSKAYCTALIQLNNWKIPADYPYKVSY